MQINFNNNTLFPHYKQDIEIVTRVYSTVKINHICSFKEMLFLKPETKESRGSFNNLNKEFINLNKETK